MIWVGKVLLALKIVGVTATVLVPVGPEFVTSVKVLNFTSQFSILNFRKHGFS